MKKQYSLSFFTTVILFLVICAFRYNHIPKDHKKINVIAWDVYGYYLYLPATFIYHDPGLKHREWIDTLQEKYHPTETFYQAHPGKEDKWVIKYSMGMAVIYSPFFIVAHALAPSYSYPADGMSYPYQLALILCGLCYTLIGLLLLRKVLLHFFHDKITSLLIILVTVGTNYFHMVAFDGVMPHNFMFTLNALILYCTIRWYQEFKLKHMVLLALALGLAILSRPTEMIWLFVPLLWNVYDKKSIENKVRILKSYYPHILIGLVIICLVGLPQLLYWKATTGHFLFYSYDEKFMLLGPFLLKFLFSYKKGWLLYTPIMLFAIAGFRSVYLFNRQIFWALFSFFIINLWVLSSWECWWYAASFSQRPMIESYVLMAIPLGYFIVDVNRKPIFIRGVVFSLLGLVFLLTVFQTWQFTKYIIDPERMTGRYYWKVFGAARVNEEYRKKFLEIDRGNSQDELFDSEAEYQRKLPAFYDFEKEQKNVLRSDTGYNSSHACLLKGRDSFSPSFSRSYYALSSKDHIWVRASAWIYNKEPYSVNPTSLVVNFVHAGRSCKYKALDTENLNLTPGTWQKISVDYLTPYLKSEKDTLMVYIWHRGEKGVLIDNLEVEIFSPRQ
jgi:hypothetical protein